MCAWKCCSSSRQGRSAGFSDGQVPLVIHHNWSGGWCWQASSQGGSVLAWGARTLLCFSACMGIGFCCNVGICDMQSEARKFTPHRLLFLVLIFHFRMKINLQTLHGTNQLWKAMLNITHESTSHFIGYWWPWYPAPSILHIFPLITNRRILISSQCSLGPYLLLLNCLALWPRHNNQGLPSDPRRHVSAFILMRYALISNYLCIIQHIDWEAECARILSMPRWTKTGIWLWHWLISELVTCNNGPLSPFAL